MPLELCAIEFLGVDRGPSEDVPVNLGIASCSGSSQDPLNYLQRAITKSTRLSKLGKKHVRLLIRKVKADGPYPLEESVTRALWIRAYSELVRLQDVLDTLDTTDKAYKPTVWSLCKLSEVIAKFKSPKPTGAARRNGRQGTAAAVLWQTQKPKTVTPDAGSPDADTA